MSYTAANLDNEYSLGPWKQTKLCQIAPLLRNGCPTYIQVAETGDTNTWVMCNPSVYGGTGQEERKGILFGTAPEIIASLQELEAWAYCQMRDQQPNMDVVWKSVVRKTEADSFKAKIWTGGNSPCQYVDISNRRIEAPEKWGGLIVVPILSVSAYYQPTAAGLMLEVLGLKVVGIRQKQPMLEWK